MALPVVADTAVLIAIVALVIVALVTTTIRRVRPNEWLVVVRTGRIEPRARSGPGIVFLAPAIDRGVRISAAPRHLELDGVPALTADGRGVQVDFDVRFRIIDPVAFATEVPPPPPAGVRLLARRALAGVVAPLVLGDALDRATIEAGVVPLIEQQLAVAGVREVAVRVTRVLPATVSEANEEAMLVRLGARWLPPDPDLAGPYTLRGDVG